jgi:predicted N-acetyltransferase YhbS
VALGSLGPTRRAPHWITTLRGRAYRDRIPTTLVAMAGDEPIGSVSIVERDMTTHPDLGPWLAAVYVEPLFRGRGVGSELVQRAVRRAAELGAKRVYLYTDDAPAFYERLGWSTVSHENYEGHQVVIMAFECDTGPTRSVDQA